MLTYYLSACNADKSYAASAAYFILAAGVYFIEGANATDCRHGALINIQG